MHIVEKNTNNIWDTLILHENPRASGLFLQTWKWGEFQEHEGFKVLRLASSKGKHTLFQTTIIVCPLMLGKSFLYCPRGPVLQHDMPYEHVREQFVNFRTALFELGKKHKSIFCKIEPPSFFNHKTLQTIMQELSFMPSDKYIQPRITQILDLRKSPIELQSNFKPKTRYNIKVAQRQGIFIKETNESSQFLSLLRETAHRDQFHTHPDKHYELLLQRFKGRGKTDPAVRLFVAYKNETPIGTVMALFHFPWVYYLHGAFNYTYRSLMAPFLIHWHIIEKSQKEKYWFYDLWGVDEKRWPGVTRFKEGFGGTRVVMPGSFDIALNPIWYTIYRHARNIKKLFL